jgi:hypothetical protein
MRKFNTKFSLSLSHIKLFALVILHIIIVSLVLNAIVPHARLLWSHFIVLITLLLFDYIVRHMRHSADSPKLVSYVSNFASRIESTSVN